MARGDEGWEGEKMEREAGGGRGGILGKIGREGKRGNFRARYVRRSEKGGERQGVGGKTRGWGRGEAYPMSTLAYKNQIHQEYSGLRKGIHLYILFKHVEIVLVQL